MVVQSGLRAYCCSFGRCELTKTMSEARPSKVQESMGDQKAPGSVSSGEIFFFYSRNSSLTSRFSLSLSSEATTVPFAQVAGAHGSKHHGGHGSKDSPSRCDLVTSPSASVVSSFLRDTVSPPEDPMDAWIYEMQFEECVSSPLGTPSSPLSPLPERSTCFCKICDPLHLPTDLLAAYLNSVVDTPPRKAFS